MTPLLKVDNLNKTFITTAGLANGKKQRLQAVNNLSFALIEGETLGLVGESGCGKSTTGRLILRLLEADSGEVFYKGENLLKISRSRLRPLRREMQMIFQDPFSSLNPRMRIGDILSEPFKIHKPLAATDLKRELKNLLEVVGLSVEHLDRYPHEFSGGQRQRIGIARALAVKPNLIIADEPVSALDVSIQAQIINLLQDIQKEFKLTYLFIAHDLAVVQHICDRVAVMYLGRIVEIGPALNIYRRPLHPYTEALLNAVPIPIPGRPGRALLQGEVPSPINPPSGCPFHPRCRYAKSICETDLPPLEQQSTGHESACHFAKELDMSR
ncbi:MAG: ATP-binding cassette domain-containing protein [Desulfuromonadales bacterium]|nr:ATP-binding cassette domain-containing protein [Desulfuromonadales bacterium]